jgi:hypothetical protein
MGASSRNHKGPDWSLFSAGKSYVFIVYSEFETISSPLGPLCHVSKEYVICVVYGYVSHQFV